MRLLATALCLGAFCAPAFSQTILLDQQPGTFGSGVADLDSPTLVADTFLVSNPSGASVTKVEIWGGWGGSHQPAETFTVQFHGNDVFAGQYNIPLEPALQSFTGLVPDSMVATGNTVFAYDGSGWANVDRYLITFTLPVAVPLAASADPYWVSFAAETLDGNWFCLATGNADPVNGTDEISYTQPGGAWTWNAPLPYDDHAIVLYGGGATVTHRNSGTNPDVYTVSDAPVLGTTITADIDTVSYGYAQLFGYDGSLSLVIGAQKTVLVDFTGVELLSLLAEPGPNVSYFLTIPSDPALAGYSLSTQAALFNFTAPPITYVLTNAQDMVLGS